MPTIWAPQWESPWGYLPLSSQQLFGRVGCMRKKKLKSDESLEVFQTDVPLLFVSLVHQYLASVFFFFFFFFCLLWLLCIVLKIVSQRGIKWEGSPELWTDGWAHTLSIYSLKPDGLWDENVPFNNVFFQAWWLLKFNYCPQMNPLPFHHNISHLQVTWWRDLNEQVST